MSGYKYKEVRRYISKEEILMRVTQEEIFKVVFGFLPRSYRYTKSPFREDKKPECYFEWYKGTLWFIDWAEVSKKHRHRDCFNVIQDAYNISFYQALIFVSNHFKLNLSIEGHSESNPEVIKRERLVREEKERKKIRHAILFKARMFDSHIDKDFWNPYQITKENLLEDNVFPIIWYKIYSVRLKSQVIIRPNTRSYLIWNQNDSVKIYTPDKKKKGKWATNCTNNDIWGYDELPLRGKKLVISKSYKDWRVLTNVNTTAIAFQNEGMYPSKEILKDLCDRFEEIIVFFDNDRAGIEASENLVNLLNEIAPRKARSVHLRSSLLRHNISDPAALIKNKGREPLENFIKENSLIN